MNMFKAALAAVAGIAVVVVAVRKLRSGGDSEPPEPEPAEKSIDEADAAIEHAVAAVEHAGAAVENAFGYAGDDVDAVAAEATDEADGTATSRPAGRLRRIGEAWIRR